jgi:hypothetical protein
MYRPAHIRIRMHLGLERAVMIYESNALDRSNNMPAIQAAEFSGGNSLIQHR